jgi:hypothetical protein
MKSENKIEKEKVIELMKLNYSTRQIAQILGFTTAQMTSFKNHNKLQSNKSDLLVLTREEEQVIIGSILGDGCIEINNREREYYRLAIKHSLKQENYMLFKYEKLKRISKFPKTGIKKDKREKFKDSSFIELRTTTNKIFKKYRENWYPNGKKIIYKEDLFKLDWLGIAIWIMDDGYNSINSITLSTDCFCYKDLLLIQQFFLTKGLKTTIQKPGRIRFSSETFHILKENIIQYFPEDMLYKVRIKSGELGETPEVDNTEPILELNALNRCND